MGLASVVLYRLPEVHASVGKVGGDTGRRDALLRDLRALAAAWPDDEAVREQLAMGLGKTCLDVAVEGDPPLADALLAELAALAAVWQDHAIVQQVLTAVADARNQGDPSQDG